MSHDLDLTARPCGGGLVSARPTRGSGPMMHPISAAAIAAALAAVATSALAEDRGVRVEWAAARVVVIPEARGDVSVSVHQGDRRLPPLAARQQGGVVVVEGGLRHRAMDCLGRQTTTRLFGAVIHRVDKRRVRVGGVGVVDYDALPVVTAHVPLAAQVAASGAVWGQVGAAERLDLANAGCGDWTIGDVRGPLAADLAGSGDLAGGHAGAVRVRIAGSGEVRLRDVGGDADISLAGSGGLRAGPVGGALRASLAGSGAVSVASVNGPVNAQMAASGDLFIGGGRARNVAVDLAGSGDFTFRGEAGALSASIVGSGDVRVAHVSGPVSRSVMGSGEVMVGR